MGTKGIHQYPAFICIGIQPMGLNASRSAVKTDGNLTLFHDNRNLPCPAGIFQHFIEIFRGGQDINIFHFLLFFFVSFTSRIRIRSGIFAENQHFL
jgi:hypothetical protein